MTDHDHRNTQLARADRRLPDLRHVTLSGEPLSRLDVEAFERVSGPDAVLANCYASNEMPWITTHLHHHGDIIDGFWLPIGTPEDPHIVEVVDHMGAEVPIGSSGEMVVCSPHIPAGYINSPEKSAAVFRKRADGTSSYHTGDFAYRDVQGRLHSVGRADEQVKVRGFALRLADVEQELLAHPQVGEAAVVDFVSPREIRKLACHYTGGVEAGSLKRFLRQSLPAHMVPDVFVRHEALPKTGTGKIQKSELQLPVDYLRSADADFVSDDERSVAARWRRILGHGNFGSEDDFFEVGGDSLQAMDLLLEIEKKFGCRIPFETVILEGTTVRSMAESIRRPIAHDTCSLARRIGSWLSKTSRDNDT